MKTNIEEKKGDEVRYRDVQNRKYITDICAAGVCLLEIWKVETVEHVRQA